MSKSVKPYLMGIVNVTPDSFSDGGKFNTTKAAVAHAKQLIAEGADCLDIGGESTRPGAPAVNVKEELKRTIPVIKAIRKFSNISISIDTSKPLVAAAAIAAGASIVNDVTGLANADMRKLVAATGCQVIIMHMLGTPRTMQKQPRYKNVIKDIQVFFKDRIAFAKKAGIKKTQIILDPGIGFGKTVEHNVTLLNNIEAFTKFGYPVLVGASRKSFIGKLTGAEVEDRLPGTLAAHLIAMEHGATWLRVHDVKEHQQFFKIYS